MTPSERRGPETSEAAPETPFPDDTTSVIPATDTVTMSLCGHTAPPCYVAGWIEGWTARDREIADLRHEVAELKGEAWNLAKLVHTYALDHQRPTGRGRRHA